MNATSIARLAEVHPKLRELVQKLDAELIAETGIGITVAQGLRTVEEQHALFMKGRTFYDDEYIVNDPHAVVTNADGGFSYHNFGLAVDCDPVELNGTIDWNADHPHWKKMEQLGRMLGLYSGADFKRLVDAPHFQLTGRFPIGAPTNEVRQLYQQGGLQAVWDAVTKSLPVDQNGAGASAASAH